MCQHSTSIIGLSRWNWDGDRIVHQCIVPSSRSVPGAASAGAYDIDVREFLVAERNEVTKRALQNDLRDFFRDHPEWDRTEGKGKKRRCVKAWSFFRSREAGSFDFRVTAISSFVAEKLSYRRHRRSDPWRFPDETLHLRMGDCEDLSFLIVSLCLAAGVSPYNLRVALGTVVAKRDGARPRERDHVWVMYKAESGAWTVVEPLATIGGVVRPSLRSAALEAEHWTFEYRPWYVWNDDHLWSVAGAADTDFQEAVLLRDRWNRLEPSFAGVVHRTIVNRALEPLLGEDHWFVRQVNREFKWLGEWVEDVDLHFWDYDPREHFDNGYVREGWDAVHGNLAAFTANNLRGAHAFALAAHGIGDFYAHSTYADGHTSGQPLPLYLREDGAAPGARYDRDPYDIASGTFEPNPTHEDKTTPAKAASHWKDRLITGRYAQRGDGGGAVERVTYIPSHLEFADDFYWRGFLPRHDAIAVDRPGRPPSGHVYERDPDPSKYDKQFRLRREAATRHVAHAFREGWSASPLLSP